MYFHIFLLYIPKGLRVSALRDIKTAFLSPKKFAKQSYMGVPPGAEPLMLVVKQIQHQRTACFGFDWVLISIAASLVHTGIVNLSNIFIIQ